MGGKVERKIIYAFFIILLVQQVHSFGILETPRIGLKLNLTETDSIKTTIKTHNPTNDTINVTLIPPDFIDIETKAKLDPIIMINPSEYVLKPNESMASEVNLTLSRAGKYEGEITVIFQKAEQKTALNSVVQINAFGVPAISDEPGIPFIAVYVLVFGGFLLLAYTIASFIVEFKKKRGK